MGEKYDFSGWATRSGIRCSDGKTIMPGAFAGNDGQTVPLVWMHQHNDPHNVLGHALLLNEDDGVYVYGTFNDTPEGQHAKSLVEHGDVNALSIYANQLKQSNGNVMHGNIREVSLVLAGANPGAFIDFPVLAHGEEAEDQAYIYSGEEIYLEHADADEDEEVEEYEEDEDDEDETVKDVFDSLTDKQQKVVYFLIGEAIKQANGESDEEEEEDDEEMAHADEDEETVKDVFDSMTDKQQKVVYFLIGEAIKQANGESDEEEEEDDEMAHADEDEEGEDDMPRTVQDVYDEMTDEQQKVVDFLVEQALADSENENEDEEDEEMKHNLFDSYDDEYYDDEVLSQSAIDTIIEDGRRLGSLRESVIQHAEDYGIDGVNFLFPEDHEMYETPYVIDRDQTWVGEVMGAVRHTPFGRVKSTFADLTEEEARAKGYLKAHQKKNQVFSLLKRATTPQTVYKKQKMDKDDQIDITNFDVVAFLKKEMRAKLDEELARAFLIGDGRDDSDDDKIREDHIRPIANDADLFTIKQAVVTAANATDSDKAKALIKAAIKGRKGYKGTGTPTMFTSEDWLTEMLLLEDNIGRQLYDSVEALATKMRVKKIVTVPQIENFQIQNKPLMAIIVNLQDYVVGADKGGAVNMFEDFDIDFNQNKYLIETRCSGALVVPYSAIVLFDGSVPTSVDGGVQRSKTTYTVVTPGETDNPKALGYFVLVDSKYVLTTDTTPQVGTTYYVRNSFN